MTTPRWTVRALPAPPSPRHASAGRRRRHRPDACAICGETLIHRHHGRAYGTPGRHRLAWLLAAAGLFVFASLPADFVARLLGPVLP